MEDLIRALQIFLKYGNPEYPTHCEHDVMTIMSIDPAIVSDEDMVALDDLGFFINKEYGEPLFRSYRFGKA